MLPAELRSVVQYPVVRLHSYRSNARSRGSTAFIDNIVYLPFNTALVVTDCSLSLAQHRQLQDLSFIFAFCRLPKPVAGQARNRPILVVRRCDLPSKYPKKQGKYNILPKKPQYIKFCFEVSKYGLVLFFIVLSI